MSRGRTTAAALLTGALVLVGAAPLSAGDHRPPDARLIVGDRGQTGRLGSFCWAFDNGFLCGDAFTWDFPNRALPSEPAREAKIRIAHPARIASARLHGWRRIRERETGEDPVGAGRRFRVGIDPNRRGGETTGWTLRFRLPNREGALYLDLFVRWRTRGDASYTFHAKLRK